MNNSKKRIMSVICIALAVVILVGALGTVTKGFREWDYKKWLPEEPVKQEEITNSGGAVLDIKEENGVKLMSAVIPKAEYESYNIPYETETAYTLKATIEPANATDKTVDWSVKFYDTTGWAAGKTVTDYVTVTPESDGSLTATVECKEAFGEEIVVSAVSRDNPDAKANCMVDYIKRVLGVKVRGYTKLERDMISATDGEVKSEMGSSLIIDGNMLRFDKESPFIPLFSAGTISDTFQTTFKISGTSEFAQKISLKHATSEARIYAHPRTISLKSDLKIEHSYREDGVVSQRNSNAYYAFNGFVDAPGEYEFDPHGYSLYDFTLNKAVTPYKPAAIWNNWIFEEARKAAPSVPFAKIEVTGTGEYFSFSYSVDVFASAARLITPTVAVTGVGINHNTIVF